VRSLQRSAHPPLRVEGTAIYLFSTPGLTPPALIANVRQNNVLHRRIVVVSIDTALRPHVLPAQRSTVDHLGHDVYQVTLHYGFMEEPDVPAGLRQGAAAKLTIDPDTAAFILGAEALRVTSHAGMALWREHLFVFLSRNATPPATFFNLPPERTITISRPVGV
jgi:KUP system potassium uptake protein